MPDAFFYFLPEEKKKEIIKIMRKDPVEILNSLKEKMKRDLDISFLYSKEMLEREKKLRNWISKLASKK